MKHKINLIVLLAAVLTTCQLSGRAQPSTKSKSASFSLASVKQVIDAMNLKFTDAAVKGDSATLVTLYHAEAKILPPNMEAMDWQQVASLMAGLPKMGVKTFRLTTLDLSGGPEQIVETGRYEMSGDAGMMDKGKYLVVWKPENGKWKLWRDIWNSDTAPAGNK